MKFIKKLLKVFLITILVIFVLLLIIPFLFKGRIIELAHRELNGMLTAKVEFSDVKLSLVRNFPNVYVAVENLTAICSGDFEGDTLVTFRKFSVTADVVSLIRKNRIELKSAALDHANLHVHVLKNGHANWNVMKSGKKKKVVAETSEFTEETADVAVKVADIADKEMNIAAEKTEIIENATKASAANASNDIFKVALRKLEIRHTNIVYRDDSGKTMAIIKDFNYLLRGNMGRDKTKLKMKLNIAEVDFRKKGHHYLKKMRVGFVSKIAADLKNKEFTFKNNQFNLNDMALKFAGSVQMPDDGVNIDLTFASVRKDFKSLLSLVPAIDRQDFEKMQTAGSFSLNGNVKGVYNNRQTPDVNLCLNVDDAMFKYPDLPEPVNNINISANIFYDGEVFDNTTVDINKIHWEMASNPVDAGLSMKTPDSDLQIDATLAGKIDFNSLGSVIPLDTVTLKGLLECDLVLAGRISALEKEQYKDFKADGMLKLTDFEYESPKLPEGMNFPYIKLKFTPQLFKNLLTFVRS